MWGGVGGGGLGGWELVAGALCPPPVWVSQVIPLRRGSAFGATSRRHRRHRKGAGRGTRDPVASMAFVTDSNRPQPLGQPSPTACLTASGAASEVSVLPMHPLGGGGVLLLHIRAHPPSLRRSHWRGFRDRTRGSGERPTGPASAAGRFPRRMVPWWSTALRCKTSGGHRAFHAPQPTPWVQAWTSWKP